MAQVTAREAKARREQVANLWARGANYTGIAEVLGVDRQTVRRDVALLGNEAATEFDAAHELHRLLAAARAVEKDGWVRGRPMQALAAQRQQLLVLQTMQGIDVERRLAEVEAHLDAVQGVNSWASPRMQAEARRN